MYGMYVVFGHVMLPRTQNIQIKSGKKTQESRGRYYSTIVMDQFCISHLSCWADMHKYIHLAGATARIFDKKKKKWGVKRERANREKRERERGRGKGEGGRGKEVRKKKKTTRSSCHTRGGGGNMKKVS